MQKGKKKTTPRLEQNNKKKKSRRKIMRRNRDEHKYRPASKNRCDPPVSIPPLKSYSTALPSYGTMKKNHTDYDSI